MRPALFVTAPIDVRIEDGVAYLRITTGDLVSEFVMRVHQLVDANAHSSAQLAEWRARQAGPIRLAKPVPVSDSG